VPPSFTLRCLGSPLLLGPEGEQIRFRTRKHFALLIRLVVEPGKRFSRESLADLLWPDAPQRLAAHSLAQAVSVLKERLGRESILVRRATVGLAEGVVDADVHHLDACDADIRGHFLDGFEIPAARGFEEWKDEWRAKLTPRLRDCLVRQMDAGRRIGDFAQVERHAQVLAELDPLSEDAVRGIMEARAWVGDRTTALKVYARHEEGLARELGAKPSADLTRMAGLLREGRGRAAGLPPAPPAAPSPKPGAVAEPGPPPRAEKRFESETLVGREKEFAALYDNWLEVRRRAPRIVVLAGDPGVGKTTLTNAFVSSCQMEGAVVARAQAYDAERELPYAVLGELVRQLTVQRAIGGAEPEALSDLSRVTPEIVAVFPGVPKPVEWSAEVTPLRLADAFLKTVTAAAEESPLVLVVDDVHAADNASAAILHIVARKLVGTRALVILAGRPSELRNSEAPAALTSDATIEGLRHLDLEPLSPEAAVDLATRLAGRGTGTSRVREPSALGEASPPTDRILRASSGNPLAIELLTREWVQHGRESLLKDLEALDALPAATLGIPRAIRTVFERQVRRLESRTRAVLDLAAVLGRRLTDLPLYAAVDCPAGEAAEALSRLLDERFLREVHGDLEFRNELIRAQAYYGVAGKVRQQLHRRVAEAMSQTLSTASDYSRLEVAWHHLRAGDATSSLTYALDGAEEAVRLGAPYEAEKILQALLPHSNSGPVSTRTRLLLARALAAQSKAREVADVLGPTAQEALPANEKAEVALMLASAAGLLGEGSGRLFCQAADRAVAAARDTHDANALAAALEQSSKAGVETGDEVRILDAKAELHRLSMLATSQGSYTIPYALARCDHAVHDARSAAAQLDNAIAILQTSKDQVTLSPVLSLYGLCKHLLLEFDAAKEAYGAALTIAKRSGDDFRCSIVLSNWSALLLDTGEVEQAVICGRKSLEHAARTLRHSSLVACYFNLAEAYLVLGQNRDATQCQESAKAWIADSGSWPGQTVWFCQSANLALMQGNTSAALELAGMAEACVAGRERTAPDPGVLYKLEAFRAAHVTGHDQALEVVTRARARLRDRSPVNYLEVLGAAAWLEHQGGGRCSDATASELQRFVERGASGKIATLAAQGFLPQAYAHRS